MITAIHTVTGIHMITTMNILMTTTMDILMIMTMIIHMGMITDTVMSIRIHSLSSTDWQKPRGICSLSNAWSKTAGTAVKS